VSSHDRVDCGQLQIHGVILQYFAVIFVVITLVAGFFAYRVVKVRDGAPEPFDALVGANK
jgi:hypothetical protein